MKLFLKLRLLPYFVYVLHRLLALTWRLEINYCDELLDDLTAKRSVVLAHWHRDETVLIICIRKVRAGILNSKSSDGQMMARVVKLYGAKTASGSSSKDGVGALKGLIRLAKSGRNPTLAVDGPRGPYKKIKPGVFQVSRLCHAKVYPGAVECSNFWSFSKSWDKTYLPKPFSRVVIHWGPPMPAVEKQDDPKSEKLAKNLVQHFDQCQRLAANFFTASEGQ